MAWVLSQREGPVAMLTLNNPEQLNAVTPQMMVEIRAALDAALTDSAVRAIVLTGAGRGFCAGAQFGGDVFDSGNTIGAAMRDSINPLIERMRAAEKPIVVAVNGPAAGAGVGIALAGDIVVASRSAQFILSFSRLGAVLDGGTSLLVQRALGAPRARALALLGEPLPAEKAADWGLIWKCVDDADLSAEAMALAQRLADGPPKAIGWIKAQCEAGWTTPLAQTLDQEAELQSQAFLTEDLREGAAAFVEKRKPKFSGR